ncbi:hypothetical protein [Priestia endophytica]|uniref:hypothetical protein n=1 Tax=Priestia endophytica TaxID=135735 RepID=UPI00124D2890|nr:hypothetical protein [Priestia endophytica]KAB2491754.1 hypothetical protein F8155_18795 [Priestia endophytica]
MGWLCSYKNIDIHRSQKVFHKKKFTDKLCEEIPSFSQFLEEYEWLITDIELFRSEWIHRMVGGGKMYSGGNKSGPTGEVSIMIPIDPTVDKLKGMDYVKRIEELKEANGTWLYTLEEFTNRFSLGTKHFVLDCLNHVLNHEEIIRKV